MLQRAMPDRWEEGLEILLEEYGKHLAALCWGLFPAVAASLALLRERQVPLALVTGKGVGTTRLSLAHFGLDGVFDPVETGSPAGIVKAAAIARVVARWDAPPSSVVYVGDAVADVQAAPRGRRAARRRRVGAERDPPRAGGRAPVHALLERQRLPDLGGQDTRAITCSAKVRKIDSRAMNPVPGFWGRMMIRAISGTVITRLHLLAHLLRRPRERDHVHEAVGHQLAMARRRRRVLVGVVGVAQPPHGGLVLGRQRDGQGMAHRGGDAAPHVVARQRAVRVHGRRRPQHDLDVGRPAPGLERALGRRRRAPRGGRPDRCPCT